MPGKTAPRNNATFAARFTLSIRAQYASDTAVFIGLTYAVNIPIFARRFLVGLSRNSCHSNGYNIPFAKHYLSSTFANFRLNAKQQLEKVHYT